MKKTLFFGLIAAALGFTACSSEDDAILGKEDGILGNNTPKKGMVLNAKVEQSAKTRATIDNSSVNWQFDFAKNDVIKVTNSTLSDTYYTFTNDGTNFKSLDAMTTATPADWYAYFPSNSIDLANQAGTIEGVANKFALAGTPAEDSTTGKEGLTIPMYAKVAILKIENFKGAIDIQAKTNASNYVTGLTAKSGEAAFDVSTSTTATSLFKATTTGEYYIAVPAGIKMDIYDGDEQVKSTAESGLTAGKYYTLTIGKPLTLTALENSTVSIRFSNFQYKKSNQDWTDYPFGATIEVNSGEYVQFRAKPGLRHSSVAMRFVMTGAFEASGNVMSLLDRREMDDNAFMDLFIECSSLKHALELQLPATKLAQKCYENMFSGCTNLETAPVLLPATKLYLRCYNGMFSGCTSLLNAPELPATTLAEFCYQNMFSSCTSLEKAPELPATTLTNGCYNRMFSGCMRLNTIKVHFTEWVDGTTISWVKDAGLNVTGAKLFYCPSALPEELDVENESKFPTKGWSKIEI